MPACPEPWSSRSAHRLERPLASQSTKGRGAARVILAVIYMAAGVFHLATPDTFLAITPGWVPYPREIVLGTGFCELAGTAGLLNGRLRRAAGIALALYAVCVFPANIKHAIDDLSVGQAQLGWWYHIPRLALQPVFVWWALFAGEVVTWPFKRTRDNPAGANQWHKP